jgi:type II secretory pathway component GspD/PulD (secretin)
MRKSISFLIAAILAVAQATPASAYYSDEFLGDYLLTNYKKKISMDLQGASLMDVMKVLSQQTGLSFVSAQGVQDRNLTLYLDKVPLKDAMDSIFLANNLEYQFYPESNIFIIKESVKPEVDLETRVFKLLYAAVPSSQFSAQAGAGSAATPAAGAAPAGGASAGGVMSAVQNLLTEYGSISEDARTNSLIIQELASNMPRVERVIKMLDVPVPKVMIEVEVVDVSKALADKIGTNWGGSEGFKMGLAFDNTPDEQTSRETTFPFKTNAGGELEFFRNLDGSKTGINNGTLKFTGPGAMLQFLKTDGSTKFLARPKILTLSGQPARINLVSNEAVTATASTDTDTNQTTWDIQREDVGTELVVTPLVTIETGEITMVVEPQVSNAIDDTLFTANNNIARKVQKRTSRTVLRMKDNETLMIGGLLKKDESITERRVPILSKIPFLGRLFHSTEKTQEERELLVFITPRITFDNKINSPIASPLASASSYQPIQREQTTVGRTDSIKNALARFEK